MRAAATHAPNRSNMKILSRRLDMLRELGRFRQLTTSQFKTLIFADVTQTVCDRNLLWMYRQGYAIRAKSMGTGEWVYQLSRDGWEQVRRGRYLYYTKFNWHQYYEAQVVCAALEASHDGLIRVQQDDIKVEGEARGLEGYEFRPDVLMTVDILSRQTRRMLAIEVDLDTEPYKEIRDKLQRHRALQAANARLDKPRFIPFPDIVYLCDRQTRVNGIRNVIKQENAGDMAYAYHLKQWPGILL